MTDQNLPPERPLSDQARAQRKADLMHEVAEHRPGSRRWLVPAVAAAAVVAAVAVGGAVIAGGDEPTSRPGAPAGGGPAQPSLAPDTPTDDSNAVPSEPPTKPDAPRTVPGESKSSGAFDGGFPVQPPQSCADLRIPVRSATEVSSIPIGDTTVRLFANDDTWIVCDEWASLDGGAATLFHPHPLGAQLGRAELGVSMNFSLDDPDASEYVAGGALPDGVQAISYTFSDGHVEQATITDDMWAMAYFTSAKTSIEGATVEVTMADGSSDQVELRYPLDFCSQSNHGC
jgi:hypothetical protein